MAGLIRRTALSAIVLPFLLLVLSGWARAAIITVNTTDGGSQSAPLCTLEDAVVAANTQSPIHGCAAGSGGDDVIEFSVTGTIFTDDTLIVVDPQLEIFGPNVGTPSGPGPAAGVTIDGGGTHEIVDAENSGSSDDFVELENLTLAHGSQIGLNLAGSYAVGGAVNANGTTFYAFECAFVGNSAGPIGSGHGFGGAIYSHGDTVIVTNATFVGNSADFGGAIYNGLAEMILSNLTFSGNGADEGGAMAWNTSFAPFIRGSVVANTTEGGNCRGLTNDHGTNLSDDTSGCFNAVTSENDVADLHLDSAGLQNNGGPTETVALLPGSAAFNFDVDCVDVFGDAVSIDQRLYKRPNSKAICDSGAYESGSPAPIELLPNSERVQVARSTNADSDLLNMAFTFGDNGPGTDSPACDDGNNALNGLTVNLAQGTCASLTSLGLPLPLYFFPSKVNHQIFGTEFASLNPGPGTVSARIVQLKTPANSCGQWNLTIEVSGISSATYGLTGTNPFALIITDGDSNSGCFDVTNAVVGNQIPAPLVPVVRRGARR